MTNWPNDPNGDMTPILRASIEEAKTRHPSGKVKGFTVVAQHEPTLDETFSSHPSGNQLTAADRCDSCIAAAVYRVAMADRTLALDYCLHHWRKHFPVMSAQGWGIIGANAELAAAIGGEGS